MREMKDSGVEWIGEIPKDWSTIRLKYLLTKKKNSIKVGPFGSQIKGNDFVDEGVPVYTQRTVLDDDFINGDAFITKEKYSLLKGFEVEPLDFLITTRGSIGRVAIAPEDVRPGIIHPCIIKFTIDRNIYNDQLLKYIFNGSDMILEQLVLASNATTIPVVYSEPLKNVIIPMAPYNQQQKIVRYLNEECTKIDAVIKKQQAIIEKLKEYKLSIITEKVSNGLNPCVSTKYSGNEFIGSIPSHWKCVKIKNVSIVVTDGAHVSPETENGVYDFISTVNVEQDHIDFDNCLKTTESSYQYLVSTGCRPLSGDVLISKDGSVGRTVIVNTDRDFVVSSSLVIIRPNIEMITSEYLNFILQSAFVQETLLMLMHGAGLRRVSVNKNANLPVLLPPIEEQKDIVKYLEKKCSDIEKDITKRRTIVEELFMYKKSIIFEAVTGKKEI